MARFDPRRDPPYFAVIGRTAPPGIDAGQYMDAERAQYRTRRRRTGLFRHRRGSLIHTAKPSPYAIGENLNLYVAGVKNCRITCHQKSPPTAWCILKAVFGTGWTMFFEAVARVDRDNIVQIPFGEKAA